MTTLARPMRETPNTLATSAYERLRLDIIAGRFRPGEKLRIETLRQRYDIGSSPMREALNRLAAEGMLEQRDQRGFYMPTVSLDDLEELTRTRCWISEIALREAIAHGDAAWEEGIVLAMHRLVRTPVSDPRAPDVVPIEWEKAHAAFHRSLIAACRSRHLIEFADTLGSYANRYRHLSASKAAPHRDTHGEHQRIVDAVLARDTEQAIALLNAHFQATAAIVRGLDLSNLNAPVPKPRGRR